MQVERAAVAAPGRQAVVEALDARIGEIAVELRAHQCARGPGIEPEPLGDGLAALQAPQIRDSCGQRPDIGDHVVGVDQNHGDTNAVDGETIARAGVGVDNIDVDEATVRAIVRFDYPAGCLYAIRLLSPRVTSAPGVRKLQGWSRRPAL